MPTALARARLAIAAAALAAAPFALAADFATPGGPVPANVDAIEDLLRRDPYDLELLISYGTSKGGSAGHLALAIRGEIPGDDRVYSANFYADRSAEFEGKHYTDELMVRVPKKEYLFGTSSVLGEKASFGLDFGEIYKRSVIGVRVSGVPESEKKALAAFFARLNDDYRKRAGNVEYHDGEVVYGYLRLNCAKTIGSAFRYGAGYTDLEVKQPTFLPGRTRVVAALNANIPTEMAVKLVQAWNARGYTMDAVLYRKYEASPWIDPHEEEKIAFKDLPDRFPSVLSRDFRREQGQYEDFDNLYAIGLFRNLGRYVVRANATTKELEVERAANPLTYAQAAELATRSAKEDSAGFLRRKAQPAAK